MSYIKDYYRPGNLKECLELLDKYKNNYFVISGGTSRNIKNKIKDKYLIDIVDLNLNYIDKQADKLIIGSTTTINEILKWEESKHLYGGVLYETCYNLASTPLRNLITIGGSLVSCYPWSDIIPTLLVLSTQIEIQNKDSTRIIPISEFIEPHPTKNLKAGEILTNIFIPIENNSGSAFIKFSETSFDYAVIDVAAFLKLNNKYELENIKIAIGAIESKARRLYELEEKIITNKNLEDFELIELINSYVIGKIKPRSDFRFSREYRLEVASKLINKAINIALERAVANMEVKK